MATHVPFIKTNKSPDFRAVVQELDAIHQSLDEIANVAQAIPWSEICRDKTPWMDPETRLFVVELNAHNIKKVIDSIVRVWARALSPTLNTPHVLDCQFVANQIAASFQGIAKISVCGCNEKGIQGIINWHPSDDGIYVSYLMTSPFNKMPSLFANRSSQVKGVGSSLLNYLKMICQQHQIPEIYLRHLSRSFSFYEKHGFKLEEVYMKWRPLENLQKKQPLAIDQLTSDEMIRLPIDLFD